MLKPIKQHSFLFASLYKNNAFLSRYNHMDHTHNTSLSIDLDNSKDQFMNNFVYAIQKFIQNKPNADGMEEGQDRRLKQQNDISAKQIAGEQNELKQNQSKGGNQKVDLRASTLRTSKVSMRSVNHGSSRIQENKEILDNQYKQNQNGKLIQQNGQKQTVNLKNQKVKDSKKTDKICEIQKKREKTSPKSKLKNGSSKPKIDQIMQQSEQAKTVKSKNQINKTSQKNILKLTKTSFCIEIKQLKRSQKIQKQSKQQKLNNGVVNHKSSEKRQIRKIVKIIPPSMIKPALKLKKQNIFIEVRQTPIKINEIKNKNKFDDFKSQNQKNVHFKRKPNIFSSILAKVPHSLKSICSARDKSQKSQKCKQISIDVPIDLGSASLYKLVNELFNNKMLSEYIHCQFLKAHSKADIKQFIDKFNSGSLHKYDFQKRKFTLFDHRRLSELLILVYPQKYVRCNIKLQDKDQNQFLLKLYGLELNQYKILCNNIDKLSENNWWKIAYSKITKPPNLEKVLMASQIRNVASTMLLAQNRSITNKMKSINKSYKTSNAEVKKICKKIRNISQSIKLGQKIEHDIRRSRRIEHNLCNSRVSEHDHNPKPQKKLKV